MYFRLIEGQNFSRFEKFRHELIQGSIGIFGENGSGKSTLLNAMYAVLTNDFRRFNGLKADCIRNIAPKGSPSWLYGEIEHNGRVLRITRSLNPAKTELIVDKGKPITDANKAQLEIDGILGVDSNMLDLYVFKQADKLYDFLATTPGERAKAFAVLCRTEKCEDIWNYLGGFLNKDVEVNAQIVDNSDELTQDISTLETQLKELQGHVDDEEKMLLNETSEKSAREILRKQDRVVDLKVKLSDEAEHQEELTAKLVDVRDKKDKRTKKRDEAKERIAGKKKEVAQARVVLQNWETYRKAKTRATRLNEEAEELRLEEEEKEDPEKPEGYTDKLRAKLQEDRSTLRNELKRAEAIVEALEVDGLAACPTCGTPVAKLHDHIAAQQAIVAESPKKIQKLDKRIEELTVYERGCAQFAEWRVSFKERKKANAEQLAAIKGTDKVPTGSETELKALITDFETWEEQLEELQTSVERAVLAFTALEADIKLSTRLLGELAEEIEDNTVDAAKAARARTRLDEHTAATQNISRFQGEMKGTRKQIDGKNEDLERLRVRLKRSKKIRRAVKIVEAVRDVMHRNSLPQDVAQANLSSMEGDINAGLELFGDPFWIESDTNLTFLAHKPGEPAQPASRLSTGQRIVVALAFWPAVASLWAEELGMLALDEPTANLDEKNRKYLTEALGVMTAKVRGKRQLIMVTHDPNLKTSFDQTITLGA